MNEQHDMNESTTSIDTAAELQNRYTNVSADAARILAMPRNSYWLPKDANERVEAVSFDSPAFLAGPFDGTYGLVYIRHEPNAEPLAKQVERLEHDFLTDCCTSYMPHSARSRLEKLYPDGTLFHWDPIARESYSDIDIAFLPNDVQARLETKGNRCQLFAQTPEGKATVLGHLTAEEQEAYSAAKQEAAQRCIVDLTRTGTYAEHPYLLRLQGTDDASWSVSLETAEEVNELLAALHQRGDDVVYDRMFFTN